MLDQAENELENGTTWQNPEPPADLRIMEKDRANCPFYSKTGACRFGDRCSRKHNFPASSPTLLIKSMFTTFGMEQCRRDDYDPDASLEYSEEETYQQFLDFYDDVLPEFKNVGRVIQFKVGICVEGTVVEEECQAALSLFNGRWYAGRQLQCEFCPVTRWKMVCLKYNSVQEENTATFFMCSEIPTMNFGKLIETSTYLRIGLAPLLVRTQRGGREWATMMNTTAGGEEAALMQTTTTREMGSLREREVLTGQRNLTNT
uniref:C3H1-type domain-containing protein n=1 Tax=Sciurus vulgaris TaxID=55149 RepID=A0A8D2DDK7_SCIVU